MVAWPPLTGVAHRLRWDPGGDSAIVKLRHFDCEGTARFVTFNCYRNEHSLVDDLAKRIALEEIEAARVTHGFALMGYVIMPEHIHLVLFPPNGMPLGPVIGEIKSRAARRILAQGVSREAPHKGVFWQKRCYDHNCRTDEATREKIRYCHSNPVRRGLVTTPGEWLWSSYNWYQGERNVALQMDGIQL